jgi:hypothetical protein
MEAPQKFPEAVMRTLIRTLITATIIAALIYFLRLFPHGLRNRLSQFEMIWLMIFSIVFVGHWLELLFINYLKFALPKKLLLLYVVRIAYWFACAIPLFFIADFIYRLFTGALGGFANWWMFGLIYIGIELFMHAIMQANFKKSFYNGVY